VKALEEAWLVEAGKNHVFPLSEGLGSRIGALVMPEYPPSARRVFYPGAPVSDEAIPFLVGGFRIEADVSLRQGDEGVLCAFGDWNGGFALYVHESRLNFAFRPAGGLAEATSDSTLPGGDHLLAVDCRPNAGGIEVTLLCDGEVIGATSSPVSIPFNFQHGGARLRLGFDTDFPVVDGYAPPFRWTGELRQVTVDASAQPPLVSREEVIDALRND